MKNKLIIGASIILVIVIASVLIIIVRNKSTEKSLNGDNYFISESAKEYRTCELAGEEVQLEYSNTEIDSTLDVDKAYNDILNDRFKLSFGVYDVYKDSTDRKFYFHYNTDKLCGFTDFSSNTSIHKKLSEDAAISIATKYARDNIETYKQYKYTECSYNDDSGYYEVVWRYFIDDVKMIL